MNILASFTDYPVLADCYYVCIVCICLHCLHMFACLMILFEDRSIKYAEAFSMQC